MQPTSAVRASLECTVKLLTLANLVSSHSRYSQNAFAQKHKDQMVNDVIWEVTLADFGVGHLWNATRCKLHVRHESTGGRYWEVSRYATRLMDADSLSDVTAKGHSFNRLPCCLSRPLKKMAMASWSDKKITRQKTRRRWTHKVKPGMRII